MYFILFSYIVMCLYFLLNTFSFFLSFFLSFLAFFKLRHLPLGILGVLLLFPSRNGLCLKKGFSNIFPFFLLLSNEEKATEPITSEHLMGLEKLVHCENFFFLKLRQIFFWPEFVFGLFFSLKAYKHATHPSCN